MGYRTRDFHPDENTFPGGPEVSSQAAGLILEPGDEPKPDPHFTIKIANIEKARSKVPELRSLKSLAGPVIRALAEADQRAAALGPGVLKPLPAATPAAGVRAPDKEQLRKLCQLLQMCGFAREHRTAKEFYLKGARYAVAPDKVLEIIAWGVFRALKRKTPICYLAYLHKVLENGIAKIHAKPPPENTGQIVGR